MFTVSLPAGAEIERVYVFEVAAVQEDPLVVYFESREEAVRCAVAMGGELGEAREEDWSENWQLNWQAFPLGRRFYLSPPWDDREAPEGRVRLKMQRGNVFGAGDHATTQMCLELLETELKEDDLVLDIGSGTGILAAAAMELGCGSVRACDTDAGAVEVAGVPMELGSTELYGDRSATLILANLPGRTLLELASEFRRLLLPGGRIIGSGFLEEQAPEFARVYQFRELRVRDHWCAGVITGFE